MMINIGKANCEEAQKRWDILANWEKKSKNRYFRKTDFGFEIYFDLYEHEIEKLEKEIAEKNRE